MTGAACSVLAASVFGPGMGLWHAALPVLRGESPPGAVSPPPPLPSLLAPNERRRAGLPTRLALAVCEEAAALSGLSPDVLAGVFASANGEGAIVHGLLETLASADRKLSPTQFHNSVHNAASGYWSIATGSTQPITCLAAHDQSFAVGLVQAVASCAAGDRPVLLCVYDAPIPAPLGESRPTPFSFAAAFVLSPGVGGMARISVQPNGAEADPADGLPRNPALAALVPGNAAAWSLRLLEALARQEADAFRLALPDGSASIVVSPC
jgi:hypothetical protein